MPESRTATPLDALWQAPVIIWTMLAGESLAAVLALAPGVAVDRWVYFGLASFLVQWVLLLTLGCLYLLRRPLSKVRPQRVAYVALGLLVAATWGVFLLAWLLIGDLFNATPENWSGLFLRHTAIAITVGLLGLAVFQNHWRTRQLAVRAKQSELEALQARIRPHFLFNTLNTGAALVHQRPGEAERLLLDLADLFRAALAGPREITLSEELALARRYLEIECLRFGDRLQVEWRLPEPLPNASVPALSIQPLVENAIRHGVEPSATGGEVCIEVGQTGNAATIVISNALPAAPVRPTTGHQVGLTSVRARVQAMTQGLGSVETRIADGRYIATVQVPLSE